METRAFISCVLKNFVPVVVEVVKTESSKNDNKFS